MDSSCRYAVEIPIGCPAKPFIPLYAGALRKKLASSRALNADRIRINDETKEKYSIRVMQGALSGVEVVVEKPFTFGSDGLRATVRVNPYSKTEHVLVRIAQACWVLLAIPTFLLLLPLVRFIILSFILAVLLLAPLMLTIRALISLGMSATYSTFGNDFDVARRAALTDALRQVPLPDPLAVLRPPATSRLEKVSF